MPVQVGGAVPVSLNSSPVSEDAPQHREGEPHRRRIGPALVRTVCGLVQHSEGKGHDPLDSCPLHADGLSRTNRDSLVPLWSAQRSGRFGARARVGPRRGTTRAHPQHADRWKGIPASGEAKVPHGGDMSTPPESHGLKRDDFCPPPEPCLRASRQRWRASFAGASVHALAGRGSRRGLARAAEWIGSTSDALP